jgi:hypothetical protein
MVANTSSQHPVRLAQGLHPRKLSPKVAAPGADLNEKIVYLCLETHSSKMPVTIALKARK